MLACTILLSPQQLCFQTKRKKTFEKALESVDCVYEATFTHAFSTLWCVFKEIALVVQTTNSLKALKHRNLIQKTQLNAENACTNRVCQRGFIVRSTDTKAKKCNCLLGALP